VYTCKSFKNQILKPCTRHLVTLQVYNVNTELVNENVVFDPTCSIYGIKWAATTKKYNKQVTVSVINRNQYDISIPSDTVIDNIVEFE
jgi:hypothetical protein